MRHASPFSRRAAPALADDHLRLVLLEATIPRDVKRRQAWADLPDVEALRSLGRQIRDHTLDHLDEYLDQLIASLARLGAQVHLASTKDDACAAVVDIARGHGCRQIVKTKSMLTEELRLNDALARAGLSTVETDLGEFLLQLDDDRPSHITAPAVHKNIAACAKTLTQHLGIPYTEDPTALVRATRAHLRDVYRQADCAITGANFAVAESGSVVLVMNEGNGRFCTLNPTIHIAIVGVEKVVPRLADLSVLLKLLSRSATGQKLSIDTHMITGHRRDGDADGPRHMHVVLVDAGRSTLLAGPYREALRCIRCGACLNTCPVYRTVGGHAYGSVYPGPIGKLLTPLLSDGNHGHELPSGSSLCGACADACPVRIDIPRLLVSLRRDVVGTSGENRSKIRLLRRAAWAMASPRRYALGQRILRWMLRRRAVDGWITSGPGPIQAWTDGGRDLPALPSRSFRDLWRDGAIE